MTYGEFIKQTQFLKDKIILPNGSKVDKTQWIKSDGFDIDSFNGFLLKTYNKLYGN